MSVANAYAKALYEIALERSKEGAAAKPAEILDRTGVELGNFVGLVKNSKDLEAALYGPVVTSKEKAGIISEVAKKAGLSDLLTQFLTLLARKERLSLLPAVYEAFTIVRLVSEGGVPGRLVAAEAISDQDVDGLARAFSGKLGKRVAFQVSTDPTLLAGMKVTVNGVTYDGTLRSQLQRLRDRLISGASVS